MCSCLGGHCVNTLFGRAPRPTLLESHLTLSSASHGRARPTWWPRSSQGCVFADRARPRAQRHYHVPGMHLVAVWPHFISLRTFTDAIKTSKLDSSRPRIGHARPLSPAPGEAVQAGSAIAAATMGPRLGSDRASPRFLLSLCLIARRLYQTPSSVGGVPWHPQDEVTAVAGRFEGGCDEPCMHGMAFCGVNGIRPHARARACCVCVFVCLSLLSWARAVPPSETHLAASIMMACR